MSSRSIFKLINRHLYSKSLAYSYYTSYCMFECQSQKINIFTLQQYSFLFPFLICFKHLPFSFVSDLLLLSFVLFVASHFQFMSCQYVTTIFVSIVESSVSVAIGFISAISIIITDVFEDKTVHDDVEPFVGNPLCLFCCIELRLYCI